MPAEDSAKRKPPPDAPAFSTRKPLPDVPPAISYEGLTCPTCHLNTRKDGAKMIACRARASGGCHYAMKRSRDSGLFDAGALLFFAALTLWIVFAGGEMSAGAMFAFLFGAGLLCGGVYLLICFLTRRITLSAPDLSRWIVRSGPLGINTETWYAPVTADLDGIPPYKPEVPVSLLAMCETIDGGIPHKKNQSKSLILELMSERDRVPYLALVSLILQGAVVASVSHGFRLDKMGARGIAEPQDHLSIGDRSVRVDGRLENLMLEVIREWNDKRKHEDGKAFEPLDAYEVTLGAARRAKVYSYRMNERIVAPEVRARALPIRDTIPVALLKMAGMDPAVVEGGRVGGRKTVTVGGAKPSVRRDPVMAYELREINALYEEFMRHYNLLELKHYNLLKKIAGEVDRAVDVDDTD